MAMTIRLFCSKMIADSNRNYQNCYDTKSNGGEKLGLK